jgi:hypothetical protein
VAMKPLPHLNTRSVSSPKTPRRRTEKALLCSMRGTTPYRLLYLTRHSKAIPDLSNHGTTGHLY